MKSTKAVIIVLSMTGTVLCTATVGAQAPGTLRAWGGNYYGELGIGTNTNSNVPVPAVGLTGLVAVDGGIYHSLGLKADGTVWEWGLDSGFTPVQVSGPSDVVAVAAGGTHNLALTSAGTVWAWGRNQYGQLGIGTETDRSPPVPVPGLTGVVGVAAGVLHSVALKSDGSVWFWGYNLYSRTSRPVPVSVLSSVRAVSARGYNTLALKADGTLAAWGYNANGELGNGTNAGSGIPVQVSGLNGIVALAGHSAALKSDGTVWTWGENNHGQLGNGLTSNSNVPVQVSGLTGVVALAEGAAHKVALKADGTVWVWGYGFHGQLGNGNNSDAHVPVQEMSLAGAVRIGAGDLHSFAVVNPVVTVTPAALNFGAIGVGAMSPPQYVTITNNGPDPLTISSLSISGPNPTDITIAAPPLPSTLAQGATIAVGLRFTPSAAGDHTGTLWIVDNGFRSPRQVTWSGIGLAYADAAVSLDVERGTSRQFVYTIAVRNSGPYPATGVVLRDLIPVETQFAGVIASQGTCADPAVGAAGVVTCNLGTLAVGAQATVVLRVDVIGNANTVISNTAAVTTESPDSNLANNMASVARRWGGSK